MSNVLSKRTIVVALGALLALAAAVSLLGLSKQLGGIASATTGCINSLSTSEFEIDPSANLKVNNTACIDWLTNDGSALRTTALKGDGSQAVTDKTQGTGDDAFGQGTAEDNPNPTIVTDSIPPGKADLKAFGIYAEDDAVNLFWSRVQSPQGTTNMDFELNQKACDGTAANCANNGSAKKPVYKTPKRTEDDVLISYDLSSGGTNPTISIRYWDDSAQEWDTKCTTLPTDPAPCEVISDNFGATDALGSVNTAFIPASETDGATGGLTTALGSQDPYTFGEASVSFDALFGSDACAQFGSAYLKSRSSDSFTAEIKDFVHPEPVDIGGCPTGLTTDASADPPTGVTLGNPISDTATLSGATSNATGTITFKLYGPFDPSTLASGDTCVDPATNVTGNLVTTLGPVNIGSPNASGNYVVSSGNYTPTAVGRYQWVASYTSGDANNTNSSTACGDPNEASLVIKAPATLTTTQFAYPNDRATVSATAGGSPGGNVRFTLWDNSNCSAQNNGTVLYGPATIGLSSGAAETNNTTVRVSTNRTVYWQVEYLGDTSHNTVSSCTENTQFTFNNGSPVTGS